MSKEGLELLQVGSEDGWMAWQELIEAFQNDLQ